jgi:hypothetical protein
MSEKERVKLFRCEEMPDGLGGMLQARYSYLVFEVKLNEVAFQFRGEYMTKRGDNP